MFDMGLINEFLDVRRDIENPVSQRLSRSIAKKIALDREVFGLESTKNEHGVLNGSVCCMYLYY
jgi:hypothetical protein